MTNKEFEALVKKEKSLYLGEYPKRQKQMRKRLHKRYMIWRYIYYYRLWKRYMQERSAPDRSTIKRRLSVMLSRRYERLKNRWSSIAGVEIGGQCRIGEGLDIWHSGVVINGDVGKDCVFHGNNIIGNKGIGKEDEYPVLGDRVDVGAGAVIIGKAVIADDCRIGAGAVVTKSFTEPGSIIAGVPAERIR